MNPIRKTLITLTVALVAAAGPAAIAEAAAKPKKKGCSVVQREFFPWECR